MQNALYFGDAFCPLLLVFDSDTAIAAVFIYVGKKQVARERPMLNNDLCYLCSHGKPLAYLRFHSSRAWLAKEAQKARGNQ